MFDRTHFSDDISGRWGPVDNSVLYSEVSPSVRTRTPQEPEAPVVESDLMAALGHRHRISTPAFGAFEKAALDQFVASL